MEMISSIARFTYQRTQIRMIQNAAIIVDDKGVSIDSQLKEKAIDRIDIPRRDKRRDI